MSQLDAVFDAIRDRFDEQVAAALQIADDILDAFRGVYLANPNINFIPAPGVVGTADQDQSWCKRTVRIPFRHDEQVS